MIACPTFLHATRAPGSPAVVRTPLVARPAVTPAVRLAPAAAQASAGSARAPKVTVPPPLPQPAPRSARHGGARGAVLLSTALHLGLVAGWAVFAAPARPLTVPDLDTAQVALISEAQFAALSAPQPQVAMPPAQPEAPSMLPAPQAPAAMAEPPAPTAAPALALLEVERAEPVSVTEPPPRPEAPAAKVQPQEKPVVAAPKPKAKPAAEPRKEKQPEAEAKPQTKTAQTPSAAKPAPKAQTASAGEAKTLKADWGSKVRARINRKVIRPAASGPGTVKVRLELAPSGALLAVGIAQGSGNPALDAAALKAVKAAAPFARAPKGLTEASYSFSLPITFKP